MKSTTVEDLLGPERADVEGVVVPQSKGGKLAIIGTATNRNEAPFDNPEWTIWGTGGIVGAPDVKRADAVFELHPKRFWGRPEVLRAYNNYGKPIYMQEAYEEITHSVRYPIEKVKEAFYMETMGGALFITNTVSFMFALAYLEGFTEIHTWGVYMEHETEYAYQRPNCEFYVGFLHAKGIKVVMHGGDVLKAAFLYGYEEPPIVAKLVEDKVTLANGRKQLQAELDEKQRALWIQQGGEKYNADLRRKYGGY